MQTKFEFGGFRTTKENSVLLKQRKEKIVEMRDSGMSFDDIAKFFNLSKARCAKIYRSACKVKLQNKPRNKSLKVASFVRNIVQKYVPFIVLKDKSFIKINYPLLFLLLSSEEDYFKSNRSKNYVRVIINTIKPEILITYNDIISRFGDKQLANRWYRSDSAIVPRYFFDQESLSSLESNPNLFRLFSCDPSIPTNQFDCNFVKNFTDSLINKIPYPNSPSNVVTNDGLLKEINDLEQYINILKDDTSLKREDYLMVLNSALSCLQKFEKFVANNVCLESNFEEPDSVVVVSDRPIKTKPKAFWPKPKF